MRCKEYEGGGGGGGDNNSCCAAPYLNQRSIGILRINEQFAGELGGKECVSKDVSV
jgi:hypothetical protein